MQDIENPLFKSRKDLIVKLDKMVSEADISSFSNTLDFHSRHTQVAKKDFGRLFSQYEMYFSILARTSYSINYIRRDDWSGNRSLQFAIATHSLKQMDSAYHLLLMGAYEDSMAILRSVYESFLRVLFVSCNPDFSGNAYSSSGQTGPKFNATNFVRDELKLGWTNYSIMSVLTHSNMYKVMEDLTEIGVNGQQRPITLTYEYNKDMFGLVANQLQFSEVVLLRLFSEVFIVDYSKHKHKDEIEASYKLLHEYATVASFALKTHSANEYYRKMGHDIDRIFALIGKMDADNTLNWRFVWESTSG